MLNSWWKQNNSETNWLKTVKNQKLLIVTEIWTAKEMAGITQNGQKCLIFIIFIIVPLLRLENIKERWKKIERYIQSIKNIYKLKWLGP